MFFQRVAIWPILTLTAMLFIDPAAGSAQAESEIDRYQISSLLVEPSSIRLTGTGDVRGLLVHGICNDGQMVDLTHYVQYRTTTPEHFSVNPQGVVEALSDGTGEVRIVLGQWTVSVVVLIENTTLPGRFHFENDVVPILSKYGCNGSGCHGKAEGQNGFKLSVFGFDPRADFQAITSAGRGRRVFPAAPQRSLLLAKISGSRPHGGGVRLPAGSREYNTLKGWIEAGVPFGEPDDPRIERVQILPRERVLDPQAIQQLRVIAIYSDGREQDVTDMAKYESNNLGLASVDGNGLVRVGKVPGQVAIMTSYMGAVDTFQTLIPLSSEIENSSPPVENNYIDGLVNARLGKLHIAPSGRAEDDELLRRVYLDIIGTLPTAEEARQFLDDSETDKLSRLVNHLLDRPEYSEYWALKWADQLRVDRRSMGHKAAYAYYQWIRERLSENQPFDEFARGVVTARGPLTVAPQGNFFRVVGAPGKRASTVSQVFLGVRIACAECHHHPFDRWSQTSYYGMSAFFQQVGFKGTPRGEMLSVSGDPETRHPRSGDLIFAHALGTEMPDTSPSGDRRIVLADWMTAPDNPWFAKNAVNRIWAHLLGRGLVEPVDDVRGTNPPTNPELLNALAEHFVKNRYDVKDLMRTIIASQTYQRSSEANETNELDEQNYSRALLKSMDAEVLLDAICQVTGIDEKFSGVAHGYRAIQLWDSEVDHYFLKLFGRPMRKTVCSCERHVEPTVGQILHVLNSPEIHAKLKHAGGCLAKLVDEFSDDEDLVEELYLTFFSRYPTQGEMSAALEYFQTSGGGRRAAAEDLAWSMMNSLEFVFNH